MERKEARWVAGRMDGWKVRGDRRSVNVHEEIGRTLAKNVVSVVYKYVSSIKTSHLQNTSKHNKTKERKKENKEIKYHLFLSERESKFVHHH